jgi:hypothetical protein
MVLVTLAIRSRCTCGGFRSDDTPGNLRPSSVGRLVGNVALSAPMFQCQVPIKRSSDMGGQTVGNGSCDRPVVQQMESVNTLRYRHLSQGHIPNRDHCCSVVSITKIKLLALGCTHSTQ